MTFGLRGLLTALPLACLALLPHAATAQSTDTVLILDASGSMWGQTDGQTKIAAAKQAVDSIIAKWRPTDRLGLMAYGHRSKGDCKDIELLVPVSRFDPERIKAAVHSLNPKGKTPMADALRAAAQALRSTENKATVVLVSDGIETCAPDPCAVAAELKKAGVGFTAHVIGFDVADPAAKSQLQCIARATGGVYLDARNAESLERALSKAVDATQGAKVASEAPAKPVADIFAGKNVQGTVRLAAGLDPVNDRNVAWAFYADRNGEKGDNAGVFYGSPLAEEVAPGNYILEIQFGQLVKPFPVKVEKGKRTAFDLVLDAAYVTSEGATMGGSGPLENPTWEMLDANGEVIATVYDPVPRFVVAAGNYKLRLSRGNAVAEKPLTVAAGDQVSVALAMDAGRLLVSANYAPGGPKVTGGLTVEVSKPPREDGAAGDVLSTVYDDLSKFDLPTGSYKVMVAVGAARRVFDVKMTSGQTVRLDANLDAGVAGIKTGTGKAIEILGAERDINNERASVGTYYDPDLNLALNAGQYVAVVEFAGDKRVEKPFTVTAGKRVPVEVSP